MSNKQIEEEKNEEEISKVRPTDFEKYFGLDELNKKVLDRGESTILATISDKAGNSVDIEIPENLFEIWKYGGDYFTKEGIRGRNSTMEDVSEAIEKFNEFSSYIDEKISEEDNPGSRGILSSVKELIESSLDDALVDLMFVPDERDKIRMRDEFKELFGWENIREGIVELSLRMNGFEPTQENMGRVLRSLDGTFEGLKHRVVYETNIKGMLERSGLKLNSLKVKRENREITTIENVVQKEVGSSTVIEASTSQRIAEILSSNFNPVEVGANTVSREEYEERIDSVCGLIPEQAVEKYGEETVRKMIDTLTKVVIAETNNIMRGDEE